jgi:hypothetical protein
VSDVELVNHDGVTVFRGRQVGGGGWLPLTVVTLTAAEIAARWFSGAAAVQLDLPAVDALFLYWQHPAATLDNAGQFIQLQANAAGLSSEDALSGGEEVTVGPGATGIWTDGTYKSQGVSNGGAPSVCTLAPGAALYAVLTGDAPPTTGECSIALFAALS